MYERFTDRARKVFQLANNHARRLSHERVGTEHILLGLLEDAHGVAGKVLQNLNVDLHKIRAEVEKLVPPGPVLVSLGKMPMTPRAKQVCDYAVEESKRLGHGYVGTEHVLLGLLLETEGVAYTVLTEQSLCYAEVVSEIQQLLGKGLSDLPTGDYVTPSWSHPLLTSLKAFAAELERFDTRPVTIPIRWAIRTYPTADFTGEIRYCARLVAHNASVYGEIELRTSRGGIPVSAATEADARQLAQDYGKALGLHVDVNA